MTLSFCFPFFFKLYVCFKSDSTYDKICQVTSVNAHANWLEASGRSYKIFGIDKNDVIISSTFWLESTFTPLSVLLTAQIQFIFVLFTNYSFTKNIYGFFNLDAIRRYSRGRSKILRTKTSKINSFITTICGEMEVKIYNTFSATDYGSRGIHAYDLYPHKCMIYFKGTVSRRFYLWNHNYLQEIFKVCNLGWSYRLWQCQQYFVRGYGWMIQILQIRHYSLH